MSSYDGHGFLFKMNDPWISMDGYPWMSSQGVSWINAVATMTIGIHIIWKDTVVAAEH